MSSAHRDVKALLTDAYARYADALLHECSAFLTDHQEAEDVVQETFLRAWEYLIVGNSIPDMRKFLFRMANYIAVGEKRRRKNYAGVSLEELQEQGFDLRQHILEREQRRLDAQIMLQGLKTRKEYDLLVMRFVEGLEPADIASVTGLAPNTVAVRIHRAVKRLAVRMTMPRHFLRVSPHSHTKVIH